MSTGPQELRDRTKAFAVRIVNFTDRCLIALIHRSWVNSYSVVGQLLRRTTERHVEGGRELNGSPRLVWSWKKRIKQYSGLKCFRTVTSSAANAVRIF